MTRETRGVESKVLGTFRCVDLSQNSHTKVILKEWGFVLEGFLSDFSTYSRPTDKYPLTAGGDCPS